MERVVPGKEASYLRYTKGVLPEAGNRGLKAANPTKLSRARAPNICSSSAQPQASILTTRDLSLRWLHSVYGLLVNSATKRPKLVAVGEHNACFLLYR